MTKYRKSTVVNSGTCGGRSQKTLWENKKPQQTKKKKPPKNVGVWVGCFFLGVGFGGCSVVCLGFFYGFGWVFVWDFLVFFVFWVCLRCGQERPHHKLKSVGFGVGLNNW